MKQLLLRLKQILCNHVVTTEVLEELLGTHYYEEGAGNYGSVYKTSIIKTTCLKCGKEVIEYQYERQY